MKYTIRPRIVLFSIAALSVALSASGEPGSELKTMMFAEASAEHPRHSEAAIVEAADGTLLIAWQEYKPGGTGDSDLSPNEIACMRSSDGGHTWSDRKTLVSTPPGHTNCYSPSLIRLDDGSIVLTFMYYLGVDQAGDHIYPPTAAFCWSSSDNGVTFAERCTLWTNAQVQFASSTLKRMSGGRIIVACSQDFGSKAIGDRYRGGACYSDDGGRTWTLSSTWCEAPKRGAMETQIEELRDGRLFMVMRTQMGSIYKSYSGDRGVSWSPAETMGIRAPESCPTLGRIPLTGDLLLLWNDNFEPNAYSHGGKRTPLVAAVSNDDGATWGPMRTIENAPDTAFTNPGIAFTSRNTAIVNYWTSQYHPNGRMGDDRISLKLAIIDVPWLYLSE